MALHRIASTGAVTLRSSFVATIIALLFVFMLGGSPGAPEGPPGPETGGGPAPARPPASAPAQPSAPAPAGAPAPAPAGAPGEASPPLAGRVIVLDAGHGGADPGAIGASGGTWEKYNTLFVALDAKALLERAGAAVILTRSDDRYVPLGTRAAIANRAGADVFISIHNDWNPNPSLRGVTTYYYHARSRRLAETLQASLVAALGARDVGVMRRSFQVVRETTMPAVLLELGFLSNRSDERLLADPAYRYRAAEAIYNGVVQYFAQEAG